MSDGMSQPTDWINHSQERQTAYDIWHAERDPARMGWDLLLACFGRVIHGILGHLKEVL